MEQRMLMVLGLIVLTASLVMSSLFVVDVRQRVILLRLGEMVRADIKPGIHIKFPLLDSVLAFDGRLQTLEVLPERFLTLEKKNLNVDFYVKWKIDDVNKYYRATGGKASTAAQRLEQIVKDGLRGEFSRHTLQKAVSGKRDEITQATNDQANKLARDLGIVVQEIRIRRMDLPDNVSDSVFARMQAERARIAQELRAEGGESSEEKRAEADREREVILANAYRSAEKIRGEGDALATEIYANAYRQDAEFYSFYRSLKAYRQSLGDGRTTLVIDPEGPFFRYFNAPNPGR